MKTSCDGMGGRQARRLDVPLVNAIQGTAAACE